MVVAEVVNQARKRKIRRKSGNKQLPYAKSLAGIFFFFDFKPLGELLMALGMALKLRE